MDTLLYLEHIILENKGKFSIDQKHIYDKLTKYYSRKKDKIDDKDGM